MPFDTDALVVASRRAPRLDPHMQLAAAESTTTVAEAMDSAGGMAAFGGALNVRNSLESQDTAIQLRYWRDTDPGLRNVLLAAGYRPPENADPEDVEHSKRGGIGGWFGDVASSVGGMLGGGWERVMNVGEAIVGETLHTAGAPLRATQHLYRAAAYITDENVLEGRGKWSLHGTFSPGTWADAWDETKNGEATFSRVEEAKARERWGNDVVDLAKMRASGVSDQEIIMGFAESGADEEQVLGLFTQLSYDQDMQQATEFMEAAHLSFGRRVIPAELAVTDAGLHQILSGGLDALGDWYGDPTIIGAKAAKSQRIARFMVRDAEDVVAIFANTGRTGQAARREAQQVADILATGGAGDLRALKPRWGVVADDLVKEGIDSLPKLQRWLENEAGVKAIVEGRLTGMHAAQRTLPFQTKFGQATEWAKQNAEKVIDARAAHHNAGSMAIKRFTTAIPRALRLNANGSSEEIGRIARLFLDERSARDIENLWAASKDVGTKRNIYRSTLDAMREVSGIDPSDPWWRGITGAIDGVGQAGQKYSGLNRLDEMVNGATMSSEAFLFTQRSTSWVVPSYKEWLRVAGLKQAMGLNSEIMDKVINTWKISVILRPGFAIRSTVEELSTAMMRYSPAAMARARMAQSALKAPSEKLLPWHPLQSLFDGMTGHLPPQIRDALRTPGDVAAAVLGDNARRAFRNAEGKLAGEKYMNAVRRAMDSDEYRNMWERNVSAAHQGTGLYLEPIDLGLSIEQGGVVVPAMMKSTSKWGNIERGTTVYEYGWRQNLDELAHDPVARRMLEVHLKNPGLTVAQRRQMMIDEGTEFLGSKAAAEWRTDYRRNSVDRQGRAVAPAASKTPVRIENVSDGSYSLARTSTIESKIKINDALVKDNYRLGMRYERGQMVGPDGAIVPGSAQKQQVFQQQGVDISELQSWFDANGGARAYRNFIIEHEKAHLALKHRSTASADLMSPESILKEIEANNVAFTKLEMPFGQQKLIDEATDIIPDGMISQREAWEDWAAVIADHTMYTIANEAGEINDVLAAKLLEGRTPTVMDLRDMDNSLKPFQVKGPELLPVLEGEGKMRNIINRSFYELIGRPMDWMIRQPLMLHNYTVAEEAIGAAAAKFKFRNEKQRAKYVHDAAVHRAVNESIQYIDDPRLRSQFAVTTRNLMPFWFAQEQFYKRVVRTVLYNPAAVRQTQLVASGFRHAGILNKDENGDDYFFIPVVGQLTQEFIANAYKLYTGNDVVIPVPVGFTGQVKTITPGLEGIGVPSFAPWVGMAVSGIGDRYPELEPMAEGFAGQYSKRSMWEMFVPSTVSRLYHAFADDPDNSQQMMSAEIQAMQYLEATGNGPKDEPGLDEAQEYEIWRERVVGWARSIMLTRAVLGFASPSPPRLQLDPDLLHKEFIDLIGALGYEEGFREYVRLHPDATPYTVFPTRSQSGGPLPVTKAAFRYIEKHTDLIEAFPRAGGWLLPQTPSKSMQDDYSPEAYREQLALEMRLRKPTLTDIWEDIKFAQAKQKYFDTLDEKNDALAAAQGDTPQMVERRRQIREIWNNFAETYKATHPVFARILDSPEGEQRRAAVMEDLRNAVVDPRYPTDRQAKALATMVNTYDDYRAHVRAVDEAPHPGSNRSVQLKERYKAIFLGWADQYAIDNPDVDTFYKMIVIPDVDKDRFED